MNTSETRNQRVAIWIGIVLLLINGLVHFMDTPDSFGDATYLGLLFVANGIGSVIAAYGIARGNHRWAWRLGVLVAGGALVGYVLSRTVGLPGGLTDDIGDWLDPLGVVSVVVEVLFVVLAGRILAPVRSAPVPSSLPGRDLR